METMGYTFRPWTGSKSISDGADILSYIHDTADAYDLRKNILCGHNVDKINWITADEKWTVDVTKKTNISSVAESSPVRKNPTRSSPRTQAKKTTGESKVKFTSHFILFCTGYYDYDNGYCPEFPGRDKFKGLVVHPQHWPKELDYSDKNIVVIGE